MSDFDKVTRNLSATDKIFAEVYWDYVYEAGWDCGYEAGKASQWVSVGECLPELHQIVYIWTTDADGTPIASIAHSDGKDGFLVNGGYRDNDVTHWQAITPPPELDK